MTGEEMERAIEFLLQSQANLEAQVVEIGQQVAETGRQLSAHAETQSEFIEITSRNIDALAAAQAQTDARLNKLIGLFEQHIVAGH